jgi:PKD domain-containing protein
MTCARSQLSAAVLALSLAAISLALPGVAFGQAPHLTIQTRTLTNDPTPKFKGTTDDFVNEPGEPSDEVRLQIRDGADHKVQEPPVATEVNNENWSAVAAHLPDGSYTAEATQTRFFDETGSAAIAFTVDTVPPAITLDSPVSSGAGLQSIGGSAGTADGDLPAIVVELFAGGAIGPQTPLETLVVQASNGSWSATLAGLGPGTYTAQAKQSDLAGNTGVSAPASFDVGAPPAPAPPVAAFTWFPHTPTVGESVSLVSSSTDPLSPITGFAWALSDAGDFVPGAPVITTSFASPGAHVVRLRVSDAAGRSSVATQTVTVAAATVLMQPFPIVRIAGAETASGARIRLLTVQAPPGATVAVSCKGGGCRTKSERRLAQASRTTGGGKVKSGAVLLAFPRFQRNLKAGAVLQIRVTQAGTIGKFTSMRIRHRKLPVRVDKCLQPPSATPISCPSR